MDTHHLLIRIYQLAYWYHRLMRVLWLVIRIVAVSAGVIFISTIITNPPLLESSRSRRPSAPLADTIITNPPLVGWSQSSYRSGAPQSDLTVLWIIPLLTTVLTAVSAIESVAKWRMKLTVGLHLGRAWRWLQFGVAVGSVVALISVPSLPTLPLLFWEALLILAVLVVIGIPLFILWLALAGWHNVTYRYIIFWIALTIGKVWHWLVTGWRGVVVVLAATTVLVWVYSQLLGTQPTLTEFLTPNLALQVLAIDAVIAALYTASHARHSIAVLSFADHTGDSNLKSSIEGIPTRLLNELVGLSKLYQSIRGYGTLDTAMAPQKENEKERTETDKQSDSKGSDYSTVSPADIGQTLQGIATTDSKIKFGWLEIPIGFLAVTFGRLVEGPRLNGSLQRVGNQLVLLAQITGGGLRGNWRVNQSDLNLEETPATGDTYVVEQLIHQLAYRVFTDLEQDRLGSSRWRAVYWFSDALRAYRDAFQSPLDHIANLARAERAFTHALSYDDQFAQCHYNLGVIYLRLNKRELALLSFEQAVQLDPNFIDAYYALADFYWYYNNLEDLWTSVRYFDHILLMRPGEARAWRLKAITLRSLNDARQLRRSPFQRERARAIEQASVAVALAWRQLCRWAWHDELCQPHKANTARYLQSHGLLLDDIYDLSSQAVLRQALYLAPDDATLHSNVGWALSREGDFTGVIRAFQTAAQMSNRPDYWSDFAWACQRRFTFIHAVFDRLKIKRRLKLPAPVAAAESSAWSNLLQLADRPEDKQFEDAVGFIGKSMSQLDRITRRTLAARRALEYARGVAKQLGEITDTTDSEKTLNECDRLISNLIQRRDFYVKHKRYWLASMVAWQLARFGDDYTFRGLIRQSIRTILHQTIGALQDLQKVIEPADDLQHSIEQLQARQKPPTERDDEPMKMLRQVVEQLQKLRELPTGREGESVLILQQIVKRLEDLKNATEPIEDLSLAIWQVQNLQRTIILAKNLQQVIEQLQNLRPSLMGRTDEWLQNLQQAIEPLWDLRSTSSWHYDEHWAIRRRILEKIVNQVTNLHWALIGRADDLMQILESMVQQLQSLQWSPLEHADNLRQNLGNMVEYLKNHQQTPLEHDEELTRKFQQIIEHLRKLQQAIEQVQKLEQAINQAQKLAQAIEPIKSLQQAIEWLEKVDLSQSVRVLRLPGMLVAAGLGSEGIHEPGREAERETIVNAAEQAVAFDPYDTTTRQQLGRINLLNHHFDRAEQELMNSIKLEPNSPDSVQWLALAHWTHAMSAPEANTRRAELQRGVAVLEQLLDRIEKQSSPVRSYEVDQQSRSRGWAHYWLGRFYGELLGHTAAIAHLQIAVSLGYAMNEAQLEMGRIYLRCRAYNQAEQCFRDVVQRDRTKLEPYHSRINDEEKQPGEWIATARLFLAVSLADRGADLRLARQHIADAARVFVKLRSSINDRCTEYVALFLLSAGWIDLAAARGSTVGDAYKLRRLSTAASKLEKSATLVPAADTYFKLGQVYTESARLEPAARDRWLERAKQAYIRAKQTDLRGEYTEELERLLKTETKAEKPAA